MVTRTVCSNRRENLVTRTDSGLCKQHKAAIRFLSLGASERAQLSSQAGARSEGGRTVRGRTFGERIKFHSFKRPSAEMERSTVWLNAIFGVASTQFQKRSQKYNILPKKTTSSSAHDVRGTAGSFSVTTPRKEVGKTSRVFTQVSVKQIGGLSGWQQTGQICSSEKLATRTV